ncbi:PREDICTED: vomeronasal type-1 receptor 90-like [Chinchilla lanigera]|uniref:vomeronasal type-1 receptor 90-like n=1 Tax=Chinchilla lanigera TaxID=34839 RepID=UPI00038F110F|nr:PREDICTED: vomeronasal type-1 receptor 90-like [Chinchilla lanigera]
MKKNSKIFRFIDIQYMFFFEASIGIIANTILLLFYVLTFLLQHRLKPTDLTIGHLAFIHIVMLVTVVFITIDIFGYQGLGNDIKCKSVIYLYRVMRGLSICTTCLLSVLQAITLSPKSSCLAKFKQKSLYQNLCCFLFLWVFNMLMSGRFLISTIATPNMTSHNLVFVTQSCSLWPINSFIKYITFSLMIFQEIPVIGLMGLSSVYMVILLYRHRRQFQHLHRTSLAPKTSPEQRATHTILLLMSVFIVIYVLDSVISSTSGVFWKHNQVHHCVQMLIGNGYATVSPLVLISTEKRMIKCSTSMFWNDT